MNRLQKLASWTFGVAVVLVAIGGFTRGSDSGYGCEDRWPLCENGLLGGWLPRPEFHMIVEWTHRWFASIAVVMVIITASYAWWRHRGARRVTWSATAAVVAILLQAGIGAFVVMTDLNADLVSVHLAVAMILLGLLAFVVVEAGTIDRPRTGVSDPWPLRLVGGAAGIYLVIVLGSLAHDQYVGGYPLVGGELIPDLSNRIVAFHFGHRVAVLLVGLLLADLAVLVVRRGRPSIEVRLVHSGLALFLTNIAVGAAHVFTKVQSTGLVVAHLLVASLAWSALVAAATHGRYPGPMSAAAGEPHREVTPTSRRR